MTGPRSRHTIAPVAHEMSIEVLDGGFSASVWERAHGDWLVQAAILHGVVDWEWHRLAWGVVLELSFVDEQAWERFRADPAVITALESVPDRISGLMIYRGFGGSSGRAQPRRPRPLSGAGAAALPLPDDDWQFSPATAPSTLISQPT